MIDLAAAFYLLRQDLEKHGGVLGTAGDIVRSIDRAGKGAAEFMASRGHKNLALAARVAPHLAVAYGAKKGWESEPVQRARMKYHIWKQRRAMKKAQRGY
jgi:hypothetical protein